MRPFTSARMLVVRKEEKQARLKEFVTREIQLLAALSANERVLTLVARSIESPAVRVLIENEASLGPAGVTARIILSRAPDNVAGLDGAASALLSWKVTADPRLYDAHEQLVIGSRALWIGDCMRRDPLKRDAYECYSTDCSVTIAYAERSFERLWAHGKPWRCNGVRLRAALEEFKPEADPELPALDDCTAPAIVEATSDPQVGTRH